MVITRNPSYTPIVLRGSRVTLRTMNDLDYNSWLEVRARNHGWLLKWEPRSASASHLPEDFRSFANRCAIRERERHLGTGFGFGIFLGETFVGEITISGVIRGPMQSAYVGYWIDERVAGQGLMPESLVVVLDYCFEILRLHRVEVNIIPRNTASKRVVEKVGIRCEGVAERYLEIDGAWEDHARYAMTVEEWNDKVDDLRARFLER